MADRRSMIEFPFRHCILPRLGRSSSAENWSCLDLFCIMVSLCGDFILRSRALEAQVNTLLFASLHIHEGHRGIRYSFFFFFPVSECGWDNEVFVRVLSFFLFV